MRDLLELLNVRVVYYQIDRDAKLLVSCKIPGSEDDILLTFFESIFWMRVAVVATRGEKPILLQPDTANTLFV
jgi:hypothetical protein